MIVAQPLMTRVANKMRFPARALADCASKSWELAPALEEDTPPGVYLPGHLDRVTGTDPRVPLADELAIARGGRVRHRATRAYQLAKVSLVNGALYKWRLAHGVVQQPPRQLGLSVESRIPFGVLSSSRWGYVYFSHWLTEDCSLSLAAEQIGQPYSLKTLSYSHELRYAELFGLRDQTIQSAYFDRLIVIDDLGDNLYKRQRYQRLRSRVLAKTSTDTGRNVYLRRGLSGDRRLLSNEQEVEAFLAARGFEIIDPMSMTVDEMIESVGNANIVVGLDGSHLAHAFYLLRDSGTLLVIHPPDRFLCLMKVWAHAMGLKFAGIVGEKRDEDTFCHVSELDEMLELVTS